jgi:hypothetical protein
MHARTLLIGAATGSALMFVLDPNGGRRRRALMRDKLTRASRKTRDGLSATTRDMANRTAGIVAETRRMWQDDPASDEILVERVRSTLGRACSHARAIDVLALNGAITLQGPALAAEIPGIIAAVEAVRGVKSVNSELEAHADAENVPSLQGEGRIAGPSLDILQRHWSPATWALVGASLLATGTWLAGSAARASHHAGDEYAAM